jgi:antitoxin component of MazEF toxin-antitoxin module
LSLKEFRKVFDMAGGNSLGICLPKEMTISLSIRQGDFVKVVQEEKRIVIEKINE